MKTLKKLFFGIVIFCIPVVVLSQNYITVDHNGVPSLYDDLQTAVDSAQNGDYIYVPGGSYDVSTLYIDKKLTIIGAGHYPDSTSATNYTNIEGTIRFKTGSDSTIIEGLYITGNIFFGNSVNDSMYSISIVRCNFNTLFLKYSSSYNRGFTNNNYISESVIRGDIEGGQTESNYFEKNIITNQVENLTNNNCFSNNIFLNKRTSVQSTFNYIDNTLFKNNIILDNFGGTENVNHTENCTFNNNLLVFEFSNSFGSGGGLSNNVGIANIVGIAQDSVFINQSGYSFNYSHNYHLKPTCPGIGAGDDGTNIGIYGTGIPYKEGAVPSNPHIQEFTITVEDNNLNLKAKVSAQKR